MSHPQPTVHGRGGKGNIYADDPEAQLQDQLAEQSVHAPAPQPGQMISTGRGGHGNMVDAHTYAVNEHENAVYEEAMLQNHPHQITSDELIPVGRGGYGNMAHIGDEVPGGSDSGPRLSERIRAKIHTLWKRITKSQPRKTVDVKKPTETATAPAPPASQSVPVTAEDAE